MTTRPGLPRSRDAGWYLASARLGGDGGWLCGRDAAGTDVRVPLRASRDGTVRQVVLLARPTADLAVAATPGGDGLPFALHPIDRDTAVRAMLDGLRRDDGRRDWPLLLRTGWRMAVGLLAGGATASGNALVAAYLGRRSWGAPCELRFGWRRRRAWLEPIDQLRATLAGDEGATGAVAWETLGTDPKMRLASDGVPQPLPAGWYLVDGTLRRFQGRIVGPAFYAEYAGTGAGGATEEEAIDLPTPGADGRLDCLVMFKRPVRALRFDPTARQATFALEGMRLRRAGRARALLRMLAARDDAGAAAPAATWRNLAAFAREAWRDGASAAAVAAFQAHRRHQMDGARSYAGWVRRYDHVCPADLSMFARRAARLGGGPTFSILLPAYETPERWLRACIDSVLAQAWPRWELCVVDDASPSPHVRAIVERYAAADPRIRLAVRERNGHISAASNDALAMARGDYIALLDHDDLLRPHALLEMAEAIAADPDVDLLYSDEDKVDAQDRRFDPYFKPDWNPDLLLGQNYVCHLCVVRTTLARAAGGFREGYEGSQDHDLVLRCTRGLPPERIRHVPRVLYHWRAIPGSTALQREAKDYAAEAGARAVADHVRHEDPRATVEMLPHGHYRVRWPLPDPAPRVSILVPTRDRPELLRACVESLLSGTDYPDFELLLVDNGTTDPEALALLASLSGRAGVRVLRDDAPFNYSALNNRAARQATGAVLALVNNDIEVIDGGWLSEMVSQALRPGVGAVGAMLLYPDDSIQHAGVVLGLGGIANHAHVGEPAATGGHGGRAKVVQAMSAVTGACLVVARDRYEQVGGLDESLQVAFNDVDFCLRLAEAGYRNVWTPFARLYHHESATRGSDLDGEKRERFLGEVARMQARWGAALERDPAYNPNLSLSGRGFELADPPRG